jgi:hypothetical protein
VSIQCQKPDFGFFVAQPANEQRVEPWSIAGRPSSGEMTTIAKSRENASAGSNFAWPRLGAA